MADKKLYVQDNLLGFEHEGVFIYEPLVSECQRFEVNPLEYYELTPWQVQDMYKYNELGIRSK
jgi:hypothetical protein